MLPYIYATVLDDLHYTSQMYTQRKKAQHLFSLVVLLLPLPPCRGDASCVWNHSLSTIECTISGVSHFVVLSEFWVNDLIPYIRSLLFTHNAFWFRVYNQCTLAEALFPTIQCGEPTSWKREREASEFE